MSIEQKVCGLVKRHWKDLYLIGPVPDSLVFLKVAGKTSPNAAIIAMILDIKTRQPVAIAKIPRNPKLAPSLAREYEAMVDLRETVSDPHILDHTPCCGTLVEINGVKILLQAAGVGHPMVREMTSHAAVKELYDQILPWMFKFHADGSEECILEDEVLNELVESPIARFMDQFENIASNKFTDETRQYLAELPQKVKGRRVRLCRQHGDFNAHNTLVLYNAGHLCNFTLIDWEDYRTRQLPVHDLNHFFTSNSHLLCARVSPAESYVRIVLSNGWYRNLYLKAIKDYEMCGMIDRETFRDLTPLYLLHECLRTANIDREQESTVPVWINRLNFFVGNM